MTAATAEAGRSRRVPRWAAWLAVLDWAGLRAIRRYGAHWVRVDVWTTDKALHAYYRGQGFEFCGVSEEIDHYPSAALFQKATDRIKPTRQTLFQLVPPGGG